MANPYAKYAEKPKENPYKKYAPAEKSTIDEIMQGPVGQAGLGVLEGASSLPGLPVEAGALLGNLANYATGKPWRSVEEDPNLKDWGAKGWYEFAQRNLGVPQGPAPQGEVERIARKGGAFAGGALPFGPAGMVPAFSATGGSEIGRATDEAGLTGGYGEIGGALLGGAAPGLVRGQTTAGLTGRAPTNEQLRASAQRAYAQADNQGVIVPPQGVAGLAADAKNIAADFGFDPALQPGIGAVLRRLDEAGTGNVTLKGLDQIRKVAGNAARDTTNASQRELASRIIDRIDDFIDKLEPQDVLAGDPQAAAGSLKVARDHWKRLRKSEMIDEALGKAERRAASTGSGGNADNATRQNIRGILDNPKKARLFSTKEKALMERVVRGTTSQNALRLIGKLSPEGSGLMAALGIGATAANPALSAFPAAGFVAKQVADALTTRNAARLSQMVRQGARSGATSARSRANDVWRELRRRAALANNSTLPALPGTLDLRPAQAP